MIYAFIVALYALSAAVVAAADRPPNIVILFADDLGYGDLGSYGHPYIRTPALDALAAEGQRWTDFYVAASVCSPSRGALLTGRLPTRTGLYGKVIDVYFPNEPGGMPDVELTIAEALRDHGYATAMFGKWHLGDRPAALPTRHGFDEWLGLAYSNDMDWADGPDLHALLAANDRAELERWRGIIQARYMAPEVEHWDAPLIESRAGADRVVAQHSDQRLLTKQYTDAAVQFIGRSATRPFFLFLSYTMPHVPLFRSDGFVGVSRGGYYGDVIEELDWSVGAIRAALEAHGIAENTLLIFTSDNGPWLIMKHFGGSAGLLRGGKSTTFEGGMRVPTVFWGPGLVKPATISDIGSTLDIFATVSALTGAAVPEIHDGYDLTPTLRDAAPSPRRELAYYFNDELRAYRLGNYKVHFVTQGGYGQPPPRTDHDPPLLYDLTTDPGERFDIAEAHPEVVADISRRAQAFDASYRHAEPLFDARLSAAHQPP